MINEATASLIAWADELLLVDFKTTENERNENEYS